MSQDITNFVSQCQVCAVYHRHHLPPPPMEAHELAQLKPLDRLVCDFMEHGGRNFHVIYDAGFFYIRLDRWRIHLTRS